MDTAITLKKCNKCNQVKSLDSFHRDKNYKDGRKQRCRECANASTKAWYKKNKKRVAKNTRSYRKGNKDYYARVRNSMLKRKFGISREQYNEMLKRQKGVCAICKSKPNGKDLSVDHNHETGMVRGLLCNECNLALGKFKDNEKLVGSALKYLEKYR